MDRTATPEGARLAGVVRGARGVPASRWLTLAGLAGVAFFALSFVAPWIEQEREVRGEGYRYAEIALTAWRGAGMPALTLAAVVALAVGVSAIAGAAGRRVVGPSALVVASTLVVGLTAVSAVPVMHDDHASTVRLSAGWLLPIGLVLAVAMVAGSAMAARPSKRVLGVAIGLLLATLVAGGVGRGWGLQLAEGTTQHWEVGSYTRQATDGEPTETMTLSGDSYAIGDRWAGTFESSGWTVTFDNDPTCPDDRGTYHAHAVGEEDLRFVMVVDPCRDGARAADLQTGTWERDPGGTGG